MQLLDRSIDLMFVGEYENVNSIVEVTEKLIVDSKYLTFALSLKGMPS